ncbi:hypothetical protein GCM10027284_09100 [Cyclobacterium sediminis]
MQRTKITPEIEAFIRENHQHMTGNEMARHFGVGKGVVHRYQKKHGLKTPKSVSDAKRGNPVGTTTFTAEEDKYIREHYLKLPIKSLASDMNRSYTGVMGRIKAMELEIPEEVIQRNKQRSYFKKGQEAFNKGKKQTDYMTPEQIEKTKPTRFHKGNKPHNTKEDGAISVREDSKGISYQWIRISEANWQMLHVVRWEELHGPVPEGKILRAKDGDSMNAAPENWEPISRAEHMEKNSGALNLPDGMIALYLSPKDKELRQELLKHPKLISIKRNQIILNRKINENLRNGNLSKQSEK